MHLNFDSRVDISRDQALVQGAKFPGAFAYSCEVAIDGRTVGKVRQTKASTGRSVAYRAVESVVASKPPSDDARVYEVGCKVGGELVFVLQKPERLRAPVMVLESGGAPLGRLEPAAGFGPRFALRGPEGDLTCYAEPLSVRGLDFDFTNEQGVTLATVRLSRKSVGKVLGVLQFEVLLLSPLTASAT